MEYRRYPLAEIRVQDIGSVKHIEWYASVFDSLSEDLGGFQERIGRRAFTKTLQENDIRALFNHDSNYVLGRNKTGTLDLHVDIKGLRATVQPPDTQWARDLLVSIERGDVSAGSFGFQAIKDRWFEGDDGMILREIQEVRLFDVSLVTFPAYPATDGIAVRALIGPDIDALIPPLVRSRAGLPLGEQERALFNEAIERLRNAVPEPIPPVEDHSVALAYRRRHLELLSRKGGL